MCLESRCVVAMIVETGKVILLHTNENSIVMPEKFRIDWRASTACEPLPAGADQGHSNSLRCSQQRTVNEMHTHIGRIRLNDIVIIAVVISATLALPC